MAYGISVVSARRDSKLLVETRHIIKDLTQINIISSTIVQCVEMDSKMPRIEKLANAQQISSSTLMMKLLKTGMKIKEEGEAVRPTNLRIRHISISTIVFSVFSLLLTAALLFSLYSAPIQGIEFVGNRTDFKAEEYYDYVIVGGGTAECPLAATLSLNHRDLVLERGGVPYGNPNMMEDGFLATLSDMDAFDSPAQSFTSEDGVPNARGRVLGGSSSIDAGFYSRADQDFYSRSGLNWDQKLVEKAIVFRPQLRNWQSAVRNALIEAGITLNHTQGTKIGGSTFDAFGRRHTAADLLSLAKSSNIRVAIYASVERVLLATTTPPSQTSSSPSRSSAIGVVYRDRRGQYHHAMVYDKGEVILCGIGARPYLSSWGIPVAHHLPCVAQFLYDNPRNGILMQLEHSLIQVVGITDSGAYLEAASNVIQFTSPTHTAFLRSPATPLYLTVATLMEKIIGPLSFGPLRLASTDVRVNPIVRFNYFTNPIDIQRCVNGTRKIADVLNSRSMEEFKFRQWYGGSDFRFVGPELPPEHFSDAIMAEFCRRTVSTIWHYHGGCLVGRVVDRNFRVLGVDSLRVVNGSTFILSPGTNPQATLLMLGRYVGMTMLRETIHSAAETGWPYRGDPNEIGERIGNARGYNGNLINHLRSSVGTPLLPRKPIETSPTGDIGLSKNSLIVSTCTINRLTKYLERTLATAINPLIQVMIDASTAVAREYRYH